MNEMSWREVKAFWKDRLEVLEASKVSVRTPDGVVPLVALLEEGVRYRRGEARMERIEAARWVDDGGRS